MRSPLPDPATPPEPTHDLAALYLRPNLTWLLPDSAPQYEDWINLVAGLYAAGVPALIVPHAYHFTTGIGAELSAADWTHLQQPEAATDPHQDLFLYSLCLELPPDLQQRTAVLIEVARSGPSALDLSSDRRYLTLSWD